MPGYHLRGRAIHRFRFIFLLAITLHLCWAAILLYSAAPQYTTPIHQTAAIFGRYGTAAVFVFVAVCALFSIFKPGRWDGFLLLPQTAVLIGASAGGLYAVMVSHYADGVLRPWPFILADQLPTILLALLHFIAVCAVVWEEEQEEIQGF